jgi:hypothetical protein
MLHCDLLGRLFDSSAFLSNLLCDLARNHISAFCPDTNLGLSLSDMGRHATSEDPFQANSRTILC